ncbi:MAG TPA: DUF6580 family putative transport protein [Phnomibacter sp.]|nr:DUF6580 family putative transport protein [Phnomibacter sp.]
MNRNVALIFAIMIGVSAAYRVVPYTLRPEWLGAPQLAMAVFAGAVIKDRKWAFALPLFSMLLSDLTMQGLHQFNNSYYPGFYKGQFLNYVLILATTVIGFFINGRKPLQILAGALAAPISYFLLSNFAVWIGGGGLGRPQTVQGLMMVYADGLPFLKTSLMGTAVFSVVFFGLHRLLLGQRSVAVA